MDKPTILVADDDPVHAELLKEILSEDYNVLCTRDAGEALQKVERTKPDLVLSSMMNSTNGCRLCRELKCNEKTMSIPILVAINELEDRRKAREAGSDDFVLKPVSIPELRAKVKSLLKNKQL